MKPLPNRFDIESAPPKIVAQGSAALAETCGVL